MSDIKKIKLTKESQRELRGWHAGSGVMFISGGTGISFHYFDVRFFSRKGIVKLSMGTSKSITLTPAQAEILGGYSMPDEA